MEAERCPVRSDERQLRAESARTSDPEKMARVEAIAFGLEALAAGAAYAADNDPLLAAELAEIRRQCRSR